MVTLMRTVETRQFDLLGGFLASFPFEGTAKTACTGALPSNLAMLKSIIEYDLVGKLTTYASIMTPDKNGIVAYPTNEQLSKLSSLLTEAPTYLYDISGGNASPSNAKPMLVQMAQVQLDIGTLGTPATANYGPWYTDVNTLSGTAGAFYGTLETTVGGQLGSCSDATTAYYGMSSMYLWWAE